MGRRGRRKPGKIQFARKCIFCETKNANSREHFYPEWMHDLLPTGPQGSYTGDLIDAHPKSRVITRQDRRVKPGELYSKKMKVVCKVCNNEWMSAIEMAAKPYLRHIVAGEGITLGAPQLETIARWAVLKTLISEHDQRGIEVTPQEDRTSFMAHGTIPDYFNVYLLSHASPSRIGYVRNSYTVSLTREGPQPPLDDLQKNTQVVSIILGSAMLFVTAARVYGFRVEDRLHMPVVVGRRIWPPNVAPLEWPGDPILTNDQMRRLAYCMETIAALPQVRWGGDIPPNNRRSG